MVTGFRRLTRARRTICSLHKAMLRPQDRLFQMDLMRRAATGDLSEIVGEVALKHDRQQRILGIKATAEKGAQAATPEERQHFGAYARGVNAFIKSHRDRLPLEFRDLALLAPALDARGFARYWVSDGGNPEHKPKSCAESRKDSCQDWA